MLINQALPEFIDVQQLRIGLFVELELGWMSHPFPTSSFKISSTTQIETIRALGLKRVRYVPGKSDLIDTPEPVATGSSVPNTVTSVNDTPETASTVESEEIDQKGLNRRLLDAQLRGLFVCEQRFGDAIRHYKRVVAQVDSEPLAAMERSLGLVTMLVGDMLDHGECAIRVLSEGMGDKASMHPVNVTILSLLLGKFLELPKSDMVDLGMAAFLHDIGKTQLPDRVRWLEDNFSSSEYKLYQDHVGAGIALTQRMGLTVGALQAIAQHHELVDGSGFPLKLTADNLSMPAKILALVNRYENLCNPSRPSFAITPHEALALIFAQLKTRFDSVALRAFIRMMGVYPPGSVVQLVDNRFALVVSVNSSRPLKPRILVHEPGVSRNDALILDLEHSPSIGILRSLKPLSLPRAAMEYLSPRQRNCYFFERAVDPGSAEDRQ